MSNNILSMILAGGSSEQLYPLTTLRATPSVPFGGNYRIIDFVLSNLVNSGLSRIFVLTQFKSHSLMKHLRQGWRVSGLPDNFIDPIPAQMQTGKKWYEGTADAIYQNLKLIHSNDPDLVCIFGGDHIYKMDVQQMVRFHKKRKAVLSVAAIPVPVRQASQFGVIEVDEEWRMIGFQEKPQANPKTLPGNPELVLASMGNYIFDRHTLVDHLNADAQNSESSHDFGRDVIPNLYPQGGVYVYDFSQNDLPGRTRRGQGYWRDVGTLEAYWEANMDLVEVSPAFDFYNFKWPINTYIPEYPPAKFIHYSDIRTGHAVNSIVAQGSVISGGLVERSVLGYNVHVNSFAHVNESVIMDNTSIGHGAKVYRAIVDKHVEIAPDTEIGVDPEKDRQRFFVSDSGLIVIPKGTIVDGDHVEYRQPKKT